MRRACASVRRAVSLHTYISREQDILTFDIAVQYISLVQVLDASQHSVCQVNNGALRQV